MYTYDHLVDVINSSTSGGFNICQKFRDSQGNRVIQFKKWSDWLGQIFINFKNIGKYQHFRTQANAIGEIYVKESAEAEEKSFNLLKHTVKSVDALKLGKGPLVHSPKVLSPKRQWYLYDMIRPHIPDEADKESTAPKPKGSRPKTEK